MINSIVCGESSEVMRGLDDESIDLIIADPPYYGIVDDEWDNQWDNIEEYVEWLDKIFAQFQRILKNNSACYVYSSITNYPYVQLTLNKYLSYSSTITWKKQRGRGNGWGFNREEICVNVKGFHKFKQVESQTLNLPHLRKGKMDYSGGRRVERKRDYKLASSVWDDVPQVCSFRKQLHSTEKPTELSNRMILASSSEDDTVLVPFCGSGSEIESCIKNNRKYIGIDISEEYCNIARERIDGTNIPSLNTA